MTIKQELYNKCLQFIDNRLERIQNTINDIKKSLTTQKCLKYLKNHLIFYF